ncbi:hypothetical protein SDC9_103014 [bioreactor metagenome]|uniref:Uncharacterized protein n=1 Tax=bioreactor metagenome TaxID=1076179 RepID=A0A645ASG2_9ZZZZ
MGCSPSTCKRRLYNALIGSKFAAETEVYLAKGKILKITMGLLSGTQILPN